MAAIELTPAETSPASEHEPFRRSPSPQTPLTIANAETSSESGRGGVRERKRKGPAPKLDGTEICLICGDSASGYHYGVLSCEGCKGFFRRSQLKALVNYRCKENNQCRLTTASIAERLKRHSGSDSQVGLPKRKCQACRYRKCIDLGMKSHVEQQQALKELRKRIQDDPDAEPILNVVGSAQVMEGNHTDLLTFTSAVSRSPVEQEIKRKCTSLDSTNTSRLSKHEEQPPHHSSPHKTTSQFSMPAFPIIPIDNLPLLINSISDPGDTSNPSLSPCSSISPNAANSSNKRMGQSHSLPSSEACRIRKRQRRNSSADLRSPLPTRLHITKEQISEVNNLRKLWSKFIQPSETDITTFPLWREGTSKDAQNAKMAFFTNLAMLNARIFISQCKVIPMFNELDLSDQVVLTRQGMLEIFFLRMATNYNASDNTMVFINGARYNKSCFHEVGHSKHYVDAIFNFACNFQGLLRDTNIIALIFVILVFNPVREHLSPNGRQQIDDVRDEYVLLLSIYCAQKYPNDPFQFCHILTKLSDIAHLSFLNTQQVLQDDVVSREFPLLEDAQAAHLRCPGIKRPTQSVTKNDLMHLAAPISYKIRANESDSEWRNLISKDQFVSHNDNDGSNIKWDAAYQREDSGTQ